MGYYILVLVVEWFELGPDAVINCCHILCNVIKVRVQIISHRLVWGIIY